MKVNLITLGCPKNLVDAEFLQGSLTACGVDFVDDSASAEALIINTCGFIDSAKEESIEAILQAVALKKRGQCRRVFVTGCLSQRYGRELAKEIRGVDGFFGNRDLQKVIAGLARKLRLKTELLGESSVPMVRAQLTPRHYAYLKISEGCEHPCTFCAIPSIRGRFCSRPLSALLAEAQSLAAQGVRELILIAQDTTFYHYDLDGTRRLPELLRKLCAIDGIDWIRLMYTHPLHVTEELLEVIAGEEKICKYVDMPIQHISSRLLKRMGRRVDRRFTEELIGRMRAGIPNVVLRTSLIVGFPGESDEDFQELLEFVEGAAFERLGVFTYSPEEGTPAASFPDQVPVEVMHERHDLLLQAQNAVAAEWSERQIGKKLRVIVDEWDVGRGAALGRTEWDCPEIDHAVVLPQPAITGNFYDVEITAATDYELVAQPVATAALARRHAETDAPAWATPPRVHSLLGSGAGATTKKVKLFDRLTVDGSSVKPSNGQTFCFFCKDFTLRRLVSCLINMFRKCHRERSEAISLRTMGLLRRFAPRNDTWIVSLILRHDTRSHWLEYRIFVPEGQMAAVTRMKSQLRVFVPLWLLWLLNDSG